MIWNDGTTDVMAVPLVVDKLCTGLLQWRIVGKQFPTDSYIFFDVITFNYIDN